MLHRREASEDRMIEVFNFVLTNGFNIRQALIQTNYKGISDSTVPRIPPILGVALLVSLQNHLLEVYKYLWNDDYVNVWGPKHFEMLTHTLGNARHHDLIDHHLNSSVGTNQFLQLSQQEKLQFVSNTYHQFDRSPEVIHALSQRYYAPYLLLLLIERDTFMKMEDFTAYNRCLENSTQFDLELLSQGQDNEDRFIRFVKYIDILDRTDKKKAEGQKLI